MEMKNKLYRHHKSKFSLVLRNFSFAFMGAFLVLGGITIPTYISISSHLNIAAQAVEEKTENPPQNNSDDKEEEKDNQTQNLASDSEDDENSY